MVYIVIEVKQITFGNNSLLVGDATADALLKYGAFMACNGKGGTVEISAISSDGNEVIATLLLGPGVTMMAETAHTSLPEPDNAAVLAYMNQAQIRPTVNSAAAPGDSLAWEYEDTYGVNTPERDGTGIDPR